MKGITARPKIWVMALLCFVAWPIIVHAQDRSIDEQILMVTNKYRAEKGRAPLKLSNEVSKQARKHSRNMAKRLVGFGHEGFDNRAASIKSKLGFIKAIAENVAYGQRSAKEVVDGWMKSPGHRKNILGDFDLLGVGVASARDGTIYYTQIFVKEE
jgi:uncharacterized protein YkwD